MLKPYDKQEDIPETLREHYSRREDGKLHADIPNDHPAVRHNAKLLSEKTTAETERDTAKAELESAKASGLPRGHVAVAKADAELLERVKPLGTFDEIKGKLETADRLTREAATREKADALRQIATQNGYDPEKVAALEDRFPQPQFKDVEVNGKKERRAYFAGKDGDKDVERTFTEHLDADPKLKPLAGSLKATGTRERGHGPDPPPHGILSAFEAIREGAKRRQEARAASQGGGSFKERFDGRRTSAA